MVSVTVFFGATIFIYSLLTSSATPVPEDAATASPPAAEARNPSGSSSTPIPIVSQTEIVGPDGSFNFSYETGNGIHIQQGGYLKRLPNVGARSGALKTEGEDYEDEIQVLQGSYSYTAPDGQVISLRYIADENGFQPEGDHLPTSPPIPLAIQRSLAYLNASAEPEASQSQHEPVQQKPDESVASSQSESTTVSSNPEPAAEAQPGAAAAAAAGTTEASEAQPTAAAEQAATAAAAEVTESSTTS